MSCPFFKNKYSTFGWNPNCLKKDDKIPNDIYNRYCKGYNYSNCPIYKERDAYSACYLTSACVFAKKLPDDCYELKTLRGFRDNWMKQTEEREKEIEKYYVIAPKIVSAINKTQNPKNVYEKIYENIIKPCVRLIEQKEYEKTFSLYKQSVLKLEKEYCLNVE